MANPVERNLEPVLTPPFCFGQVLVREATTGGFVVSHRDDESNDRLLTSHHAEDAIEIVKYDRVREASPSQTGKSE